MTKKAKAQFELNLAWGVKENKKGFFKYVNNRRNTKENVGLLLNDVGALVKKDTENAKLLNVFFASVFTAKASPPLTTEPRNKRENLERGRLSPG